MKRGIKALCKYLLVSISTIVATVIVFNLFRNGQNTRATRGILQGQGAFPIEPESLRFEARDSMLAVNSQITSVKKIDWHNYDQIARESKRVGTYKNESNY